MSQLLIKKYEIVCDDVWTRFTNRIEELIEEGWQILPKEYHPIIDSNYYRYIQPMYLPKDAEEEKLCLI